MSKTPAHSNAAFADKLAGLRVIEAKRSSRKAANRAALDPVITAATRVTLAPAFVDLRFRSVGPIVGGFADLGIGRYEEAL